MEERDPSLPDAIISTRFETCEYNRHIQVFYQRVDPIEVQCQRVKDTIFSDQKSLTIWKLKMVEKWGSEVDDQRIIRRWAQEGQIFIFPTNQL